ncbi:MAG: hypothetical protein HFF76_00550 [Oscillospiraceae bacterium]|jgi:hypothetical protein|nr:hypothetical protein [Oscillospiraceae bacterium]
MERREYLARLDRALRELTGSRERQDILAYYREYLEEAGSEGETEAMDALGAPEVLALRSVEPVPETPPLPRRRPVPRPVPEDACRSPAALLGLRFEAVRLDVDGVQVRLEAGEAFLVRLDGEALACAVQDGVLRVSGSGEAGSLVSITVPQGERLEEVRLRTRGGDVLVGAVEIGRLSVDAGAGSVELRGARAGALDLCSRTGISTPGSRVPQRLRGRAAPGRRQTNRREHGPMKTNVFLRSTRRQPVRAVCLVLVTVFVTFAFVGRASEYLLIKQETERLGSWYRTVGELEPLEKGAAADLESAAAYLAESSYIKLADRPQYTSAVMKDVYNADTDGTGQPAMEFGHVFFYGTLTDKMQLTPGNYKFYFTVDSVAAGYPEYIALGAKAGMQNNIDDLLGHGYYQYEDLAEPFAEMEVGQRYFLRGSKNEVRIDQPEFRFTALTEDGPWYIPVEPEEEIDFTAPEWADVAAAMALQDGNMHALSVIAVQDMSALPETQEASGALYLTEGRWLTNADHAQGRKVCVIREALAERRDLHAGDTLDLTLRDITNGEYDYGNLYLEEDLARRDSMETASDTYEIVGIYNAVNASSTTCYSRVAYIPASAVPEGFSHAAPSETVKFELASPAEELSFLAEAEGPLAALGLRPVLVENGFADFQAAAKPMARSARFNALVYSAVLLVALCLVEFLYFFMRRQELAIARALGLPAKRCAKQSALPLLMTGFAAILAGGVLGWRHTLDNAAVTLEALSAFGGSTAGLSGLWLVVLCGAVLALFLGITAVIASALVKRPVLRQMQGRVQKKARKTGPVRQEGSRPLSPLDLSAALSTQLPRSRTKGIAFVFRFALRHVLRAPVKSLLAMGLAAVFTVGLAVMQLSITTSEEELASLYENTSVALDIVRVDTERYEGAAEFLREATVQKLLDAGYVANTYLEGHTDGAIRPHAALLEEGEARFLTGLPKQMDLRSLTDWDAFTSIGSGADVTATFFESWDKSLFARDWSQTDLPPVLISRFHQEFYDFQPGDTIGILCKGAYQVCQVAGVYEGAVSGADRGFPVLLPESVLRSIRGEKLAYIRAHFSLDPAKNREMAGFRTVLEEIVSAPGAGLTPLRAVLLDEELRQAVEPLEDSIALMKLLYPVVVVLSVLVAAGVSVLFVMLSAKEAAILRVQGTSRPRTVVMLLLQQFLPSILGLAAGLAGILISVSGARPPLLPDIAPGAALCAGLYLLSAIAGAVSAAILLTAKNPLEMLQVRE